MSTQDKKTAETLIAESVLGILEPEEQQGLGDELRESVELRQDFLEVEETLADLAGALDTMQPSESLRGSVLSSLDPASRFEGLLERIARFLDLDTSGTRLLLDHLAPGSPGSWIDDLVNGTRFLQVDGGPCRASSLCALMVMQPDGALPSHSHGGDEWVLVLQGTAQDHREKQLQTGDLAHFAAGSAHLMRCASDEPFVAAIVLGESPEPGSTLVLEPAH
jgi:quercetin dioxygenase-like cupin family protein